MPSAGRAAACTWTGRDVPAAASARDVADSLRRDGPDRFPPRRPGRGQPALPTRLCRRGDGDRASPGPRTPTRRQRSVLPAPRTRSTNARRSAGDLAIRALHHPSARLPRPPGRLRPMARRRYVVRVLPRIRHRNRTARAAPRQAHRLRGPRRIGRRGLPGALLAAERSTGSAPSTPPRRHPAPRPRRHDVGRSRPDQPRRSDLASRLASYPRSAASRRTRSNGSTPPRHPAEPAHPPLERRSNISTLAKTVVACSTLFLMLVVLISAAAPPIPPVPTGPLASPSAPPDVAPPLDRQTGAAQYAGLLASAEQAAPNPAAASAIVFAARQLGLPYVWGGNGPSKGDAGYDCSGLTMAAYASAGISIPRTATDQYRHGVSVPLSSLRPGDLVFYGNDTFAHHVGIYVGSANGSGVILDAPKNGAVVRFDTLAADDLFAATRPSATH